MREVTIQVTNNGFIAEFKGLESSKGKKGRYVYRAIDDLVLVKEIGEFLAERKLKVEEQ